MATGGGRVPKYDKAEIMRLENNRLLDVGKIKALYRAGWSIKEIALDVHVKDINLIVNVLRRSGLL